LEAFIEKSGHVMLSIKMIQEKEYEEMVASNEVNYLNIILIEIFDILNSGKDIEDREMMKYEIIDET